MGLSMLGRRRSCARCDCDGPARRIEIPEPNDLQESHTTLAERVKTRTQERKQQGGQQGEAKLLRRQLSRRFGPLPLWTEQRLEQAGEAELETWADRVLECRSLDEVFGAVV